MFIIFRWWYFAGIAGIGLTIYGGVETKLALQSSSEPIAVTIDDLDSGTPLAQPFVRLGAHVALEPLGVARRAKRSKTSKVVYPLVGVEHPIVRALADRPRTKSELPGFADCHVFALRQGTVLSTAARTGEGLEGTVFDFEELSTEERNLVTLAVPSVDRAAVRVLEVGRRPKPLALVIGSLLAGITLVGLAIRLFRGVRANQPSKPKKPKEPREPKPPKADQPFLHEGLDKRRFDQ